MEKHYICLGGCKGVSKVPGVCQATDCVNHNHELVECSCVDGIHNNFKQKVPIHNSVSESMSLGNENQDWEIKERKKDALLCLVSGLLMSVIGVLITILFVNFDAKIGVFAFIATIFIFSALLIVKFFRIRNNIKRGVYSRNKNLNTALKVAGTFSLLTIIFVIIFVCLIFYATFYLLFGF